MPRRGIWRARQQCLALYFAQIGVIAVVALGIAGCSLDILSSPEEVADKIGRNYGWQKRTFPGELFYLRGYQRRATGVQDRLAVYIEGDGNAWISEYLLSTDPTPARPLTFNLAVRHPPGPVLYLARPCHYVSGRYRRACHPRYWSSHRYAPEVVIAMNAVINQVKKEIGASGIELYGWSGGGVVAALLAARRNDVVEIVTLAANLDHQFWTRMDKLTPLYGSLNPADLTHVLEIISQRHFVGTDDVVVAPAVVRSYVGRMKDKSRTRIIMLNGYDHDCCWVDNWPAILGN